MAWGVAPLRRRAATFVVALVPDLHSVREELGLAGATVSRKGTRRVDGIMMGPEGLELGGLGEGAAQKRRTRARRRSLGSAPPQSKTKVEPATLQTVLPLKASASQLSSTVSASFGK